MYNFINRSCFESVNYRTGQIDPPIAAVPHTFSNNPLAAASGAGSPYKIVPAGQQAVTATPMGGVAAFVTVKEGASPAASPGGRQQTVETALNKGHNKAKRRQGGGGGALGHQSRNTLKRMLDKLGLSDADAGGGTETVPMKRAFSSHFFTRQEIDSNRLSLPLLGPDTIKTDSNYINAQREFLSQLKLHASTPAGVPPPSTPNVSVSAAAAFVTAAGSVPHRHSYRKSPSAALPGNIQSALVIPGASDVVNNNDGIYQQLSFSGFGFETAPRDNNVGAYQEPISKVRSEHPHPQTMEPYS